jgi:hypothetical protein
MTVTAEIDIESATGRRIVRELEKHHKVVKLNYPIVNELQDEGTRTYTYQEFKENVKLEFKKRYGVGFDNV